MEFGPNGEPIVTEREEFIAIGEGYHDGPNRLTADLAMLAASDHLEEVTIDGRNRWMIPAEGIPGIIKALQKARQSYERITKRHASHTIQRYDDAAAAMIELLREVA